MVDNVTSLITLYTNISNSTTTEIATTLRVDDRPNLSPDQITVVVNAYFYIRGVTYTTICTIGE